MGKVNIALVVLGIAFILVPLGLFAFAFAVYGYASAARFATIWLVIWAIVLCVVPLALFGGLAIKGLPWVTSKVGGLTSRIDHLAGRTESLGERAGRATIAPDLWLYSRVAWVRGFVSGLRRAHTPRRP